MMLNSVNILACPTPTSNEPQIKFKPSETITGKALEEFAKLPVLGAYVLHPKHSFFLIGMSMMMGPSGGGYLSGFDQSMGFLLVAASPVVAIAKAVFSAGTIAVGTVGTAILAPSYVVEKGVRVAINSDKLNDPQLKRTALIEAFVKRMSKLIDRLSQGEESKRLMIRCPKEIAIMSAISLAFNSKSEYGSVLVMGDGQKLKREDINMLDPLFQNYFIGICDIKSDLRAIEDLHKDANENWVELMQNMDALSSGRTPNGKNYHLNRYNSINEKAHELADSLCKDNDFINAWRKIYPEFNNSSSLESLV